MRLNRATTCVRPRAADMARRYNGCRPLELLQVRRLPAAPKALSSRSAKWTLDKSSNQTVSMRPPHEHHWGSACGETLRVCRARSSKLFEHHPRRVVDRLEGSVGHRLRPGVDRLADRPITHSLVETDRGRVHLLDRQLRGGKTGVSNQRSPSFIRALPMPLPRNPPRTSR